MSLILNLAILVAVVIWLALVYWTWADARRRISDRFLISCAVVAALFPFIGSLVYLIVRPPEYLEDVRERNLEIAAAEARLAQAQSGPSTELCPHCDQEIGSEFVRCPSCLRRLREPCPACSRPLEPEWRICPYCEADPQQPKPRRATRRAAGSGPVDSSDVDGRSPARARSSAAPAGRDGDGAKPTKATPRRSTVRRSSADGGES